VDSGGKDDTNTDFGISPSGSGTGINVLGLDEGNADPSAQTAVSSGFGDQVNLEAMGSGSGLLDLTRERDDTSLGAPILGDIDSTGTAIGGPALTSNAGMTRSGGMPLYIEATDSLTPALGGAALAAGLFTVLGLISVAGGIMGQPPSLLSWTFQGTGPQATALPIYYLVGGGFLAAIIGALIGFVLGKKK